MAFKDEGPVDSARPGTLCVGVFGLHLFSDPTAGPQRRAALTQPPLAPARRIAFSPAGR